MQNKTKLISRSFVLWTSSSLNTVYNVHSYEATALRQYRYEPTLVDSTTVIATLAFRY